MLNRLGYGEQDSPLVLDLVYNPGGPALPPEQSALEEEYRKVLLHDHGVRFSSLIAITNMPIKRFADDLLVAGKLGEYMELLSNSFNAATIDGLMCRNTMNVGWDGKVYDCDFNAALEVGSRSHDGNQLDIWKLGK
jgi:radical SAM/Cys-rich protein